MDKKAGTSSGRSQQQLILSDHGVPDTVDFQVLPRYKYRQEGDKVGLLKYRVYSLCPAGRVWRLLQILEHEDEDAHKHRDSSPCSEAYNLE